MARVVDRSWAGGLYRFRLWSSPYDPYDVSDVTAVTLTRDGTAYTDVGGPAAGSFRWGQTEYHSNEIVVKASAGLLAESGDITLRTVSPTETIDWDAGDIGNGGQFVAAAGVWVEQCDICGLWYPIESLVRQLQIRHQYEGANYCDRSRYNPAEWTATTDYLGDVSMGRPRWRHIIDPEDKAPSRMADGASSFWGDGNLTQDSAIDMSTWTTALIQGQFGVNQITTFSELDVVAGFIYDPGGVDETFYQAVSLTSVLGGQDVWGTVALASVAAGHRSALHPTFRVTTATDQQVWWGERFRVQKDVSNPKDTFFSWVETKGSPVAQDEKNKVYGMAVVCPKDWERFKKQVDEYKPSFDSIDTIEVEQQEF